MRKSNGTIRHLAVGVAAACAATFSVLAIGAQLGKDASSEYTSIPGMNETTLPDGSLVESTVLGVDPAEPAPAAASSTPGAVSAPNGGTAVPQTPPTTVLPGSEQDTVTSDTGDFLPIDTTAPGATWPTNDTVALPVSIAGPSKAYKMEPPRVQGDGGIIVIWKVKGSDDRAAFAEVQAQLTSSGWVEVVSTATMGEFQTETRWASVTAQLRDDGDVDLVIVFSP